MEYPMKSFLLPLETTTMAVHKGVHSDHHDAALINALHTISREKAIFLTYWRVNGFKP